MQLTGACEEQQTALQQEMDDANATKNSTKANNNKHEPKPAPFLAVSLLIS